MSKDEQVDQTKETEKETPDEVAELEEATGGELENVDEVKENKPEAKDKAEKQAEADEEEIKTQKQTGERGWYVIHTYSGYEEQVSDQLKQRIESLGMEDKIFQVLVPKEKQIEIKNGKRRTVEKRIFPGYVMVEMIVTDDSWYVVRNTPNVTGFIGLGVRPTPMMPEEIDRIKKRMGVEEPKYKIEFRPGDLVRIVDGPLKGFEAKVTDIDEDKGKVKILVSMFGRETPVSLDFLQVKKV
ncbi:TPA: transcription termination/antitermination protein NusG [Candidatus Berkelbacteria bacterium]|uniref:Transcription termination/antitermination protein NusG n=1 Tax=Berkelbacteria bacterium GW2011_GWE1_39_12 TaxID=1618337 RepID=A0A0G4B1P6_9BACT|nr:MAG: transcription antitermination factor [Berkelbacteria bacterium GW2011_GWE1_39_12]HBO60453.1 transcription termination/antitermination protein NusG [Candidatus Berkelbacteria bacterium]